MKYYVYDKDGCGYIDSILVTTKPVTDFYCELIGVYDNAYDVNHEASRYLYDIQRQIDIHCDYDYYEGGEAYKKFTEDDVIEFIKDDDYEDDDDYDDDYEDDDDYDDDYEDDDEEW